MSSLKKQRAKGAGRKTKGEFILTLLVLVAMIVLANAHFHPVTKPRGGGVI